MIEPNQYTALVKDYYSFLETEFKMPLFSEKTDGDVLTVEFGNRDKIVSISYENSEDYFQVMIYNLINGKMPDYDDKARTLHLSMLNTIIYERFRKHEIEQNNEYFGTFRSQGEVDRKLLRGAIELRLAMMYFDRDEVQAAAQVS